MNFIVVPKQKFDLTRVINIMKCDCSNCDYMHCPKKNYAVRTKIRKLGINEFIKTYSEKLKEKGFTKELIEDYFSYYVAFPKGLYWNFNYINENLIEFYKYNQRGEQILAAMIDIRNPFVNSCDTTTTQYNFLTRVCKHFNIINNVISNKI